MGRERKKRERGRGEEREGMRDSRSLKKEERTWRRGKQKKERDRGRGKEGMESR